MKYRKKPVVIEARLLTPDNVLELARWSGAIVYRMPNKNNPWGYRGPIGLNISTLEGRMFAGFGDYIIKGIKGEFYPCKPDIFEATYEPVKGAK